MQIKTIFNLGDTVWVMKDNKPWSFVVAKIETVSKRELSCDAYRVEETTEIYYYSALRTLACYKENEVFGTKQGLLESL